MLRSFFGLATLIVAGLLATVNSKGSEIATATISDTEISPGEFQYNLTLDDTGTTTIGTFWFGWVPGDNFMPADPTDITSPAGWQDMVTNGGPSGGFAIQWTAKTPANDLAAGNTLLGFSFDSSLTLAQLEKDSSGHPTDPVDTAFVYSGEPFSDAGFQLTAHAVATPEPSTTLITAFGFGLIALGSALVRRRKKA
jgi:PEP-CTERM motif